MDPMTAEEFAEFDLTEDEFDAMLAEARDNRRPAPSATSPPGDRRGHPAEPESTDLPTRRLPGPTPVDRVSGVNPDRGDAEAAKCDER